MKKIEMTLCYFITENKILLPLKKKKIGKGKHNGVGGKLEKQENHEEAMIRECIEEVGLKPVLYKYMAKIVFEEIIDKELCEVIVYVYTCTKWGGILVETEEMKPYWFDLNNIPYDKTMEDDKYWLHYVLDNKKIIANFKLDENYNTIDYSIKEVDNIVDEENLYKIELHMN